MAFDEKRLVCTVIVSVPKALKRFSTERVEPLPIEVSATTAATPMTMPRMVSTARSGLARRLENAMRSDSRTTIIGRRRRERRRRGHAAAAAEAAAAEAAEAAEAAAVLVLVLAGAGGGVGVRAGDDDLTGRQAARDLR